MKSDKSTAYGVGVILGIWLTGVFGSAIISRMKVFDSTVLPILIYGMSIIWPFVYFVLSRAKLLPKQTSAISNISLGIFFLSSIISTFMSPNILNSLGYVVLTFAAILIAMQFNINIDSDKLETGLKLYAVSTAVLLIWFAVEYYQPGLRLGQAPYSGLSRFQGVKVLNPNSIAIISMSVIICTMAIRNFASRIVIMSAVIAVLFLTGSRTSTIATIFGLLIVIWYRLKARSMMFKIALLVSFIFAIITVLLTVDPAINSIKEYFAISDRYRGFGTGASGRVEAWGSAWRLFLNHPLTGVGFRAHERYLSGAEGASSHNGYLAALAEIGLIGFCSNILFIFFGFFRLKSIVNIPNLTFSHSVLFGLACGYLLIGLFERYLINVGNPTSLLFLLCLTLPVESKGTQSKFVNQVLIEKKFA